jgi:hypothetical protein
MDQRLKQVGEKKTGVTLQDIGKHFLNRTLIAQKKRQQLSHRTASN